MPSFGFPLDSTLSPDALCTIEHMRRIDRDEFNAELIGGVAGIRYRGLVAFLPTPIDARTTQNGVEEPYIWRLNQASLVDQLDGVSLKYGLRLVAGQAVKELGGWRAYFVDRTGTPGRRIHRVAPAMRFGGKTLDEACWAAVRDTRAFPPRLPMPA